MSFHGGWTDPVSLERYGVYMRRPQMVWAGPYHDAHAMDEATLCWFLYLTELMFSEAFTVIKQGLMAERHGDDEPGGLIAVVGADE